MKYLTSKQVRQMWLDFFESKGHKIVESKSLIPVNDPSLLWINSGVATLKDYFSGKKKAPAPRITNSQRSIRTNDIENVGVTARHHTLFEMLGNFSIGDYFKNEVIEFASELLFDVYGLEKEKIYITYFEEDAETFNKWTSVGIDPSHMIKGDRDMNFWDVGQGPCGPDTEIFYDRGEKYDPEGIGLKLLQEDLENDRYIEIWNIVFSQFNNDGSNNYSELVQKNIDTGAGLERITSIFQDAPTNFDTDLFMPMINVIEDLSDKHYDKQNYFTQEPEQEKVNKSFKIIADHVRSVAIAIHDGAKPSNNGRGYIIRRLLRRAVLEMMHLNVKNIKEGISLVLPEAFESVNLGASKEEFNNVYKTVLKEITAFEKTIDNGNKMIKSINKSGIKATPKEVFDLFATFGFPIEASIDLLDNAPALGDILAFKEKHAEVSRGGKVTKAMASQIAIVQTVDKKISEFTGFSSLKEKAKVLVQAKEGNKNYILLDKTPFYATGGGQHCDYGTIDNQKVLDVFKDKNGNNWHVTANPVGETVVAEVSSSMRMAKSRNHSATHLLGFALRNKFGKSVVQLGSDNNEDKLRFDFPLERKATPEELEKVQEEVNKLIQQGIAVDTNNDVELPIEEGLATGAITIPGEEYGDTVRVVRMNDAIEFCGGTHVSNTKDIEAFAITKFESKGSGTFRIEAVTGKDKVDAYVNELVLEKEKELLQVIKKNKALNASYSLKYTKDLKSLDEALAKSKADNKKLVKASKHVAVDTSSYEAKDVNGTSIVETETQPGQVKPLALALREAFPESLIIVKAPAAGLIAVASTKYNVLESVKEQGLEVRGGGNERFLMGKLA